MMREMKTKPILLVAWMLGLILHAQPEAKPAPAPAIPAAPARTDPRDLIIRYEVFSVAPARAAVMLREKPSDRKFYEALVTSLASGEVIQEELTVIRGRSGNKARTQSIREYIYPTEFMPSMVTTSSAKTKEEIPLKAASPEVVVPAAPTAFETRDTGLTIEIETTMGEDRSSVELRMVSEHVGLAERSKWGRGTSEIEMPYFESQRITTHMMILMGVPTLVGTPNPPPVSKMTPDRVWFAFATIKLNQK